MSRLDCDDLWGVVVLGCGGGGGVEDGNSVGAFRGSEHGCGVGCGSYVLDVVGGGGNDKRGDDSGIGG